MFALALHGSSFPRLAHRAPVTRDTPGRGVRILTIRRIPGDPELGSTLGVGPHAAHFPTQQHYTTLVVPIAVRMFPRACPPGPPVIACEVQTKRAGAGGCIGGTPAFRPSESLPLAGRLREENQGDVSDSADEWQLPWPEGPEAPRSPQDAAWADSIPDLAELESRWREGK